MTLLVPEYLQTKQYSAAKVRGLYLDMPLQEGVINPKDSLLRPLAVEQRGAGANKTVDIKDGAGWVRGDVVTSGRQGMYHVVNDATVNLAIPDNATANPRIDQIVCRVHDTAHGAVADAAQFEVVQGTPTAGATLDNRNGAAALPSSAIRLADVLAGASFTSITNSVIRDRRPWAHGAYGKARYTGGNGAVAATANAAWFASILVVNLEVSSPGYVRITWTGGITSANAGYTLYMFPVIDGAYEYVRPLTNNAGASSHTFSHVWELALSAGFHTFQVGGRASSAVTTTLIANITSPMDLIVEEILQPNNHNT